MKQKSFNALLELTAQQIVSKTLQIYMKLQCENGVKKHFYKNEERLNNTKGHRTCRKKPKAIYYITGKCNIKIVQCPLFNRRYFHDI